MTTAHNVVRFPTRVCALSFLLLFVSIPTIAQTNKGTIKGRVTDQNGAVVQNAEVTVTNTETNVARSVNGGDDGTYEVPLLEPGKYKVSVKAASFSETVRENVTVQTASTEVVDVTLTAGGVGGVVTVSAAPNQLETETSDRGSVVTGREVTELPLSGRNFTQLATLTPGVSRVTIGTLSDARANNNGDPNAGGQGPGGGDPRGSTESARFARSGGAVLSANGQRPTNNNFSVDGVDNNEPQFGTIGVFVNPDAIAEFKVTTSVPTAEIGRASGAVINTTFQSGTNDFHGSAYYYGQNSALNAYHPILKRNRAEAIARGDLILPTKAVQQIHEFGGTVGGPIIRDRTFFFFDYLGGRNNLPTPLASTVPTADVRNGIFGTTYTSTRDCGRGISGVICDATTGLPFANATIPANRISTNTQKFFNLFPAPTANRLNPGQFDNNFFTQRGVSEKIDNFDIKIDHRLSNVNSLSGRYSHQNFSAIRGSFFPQVPAGFGAGDEFGNTRQIVVTDTHTFSPTILNEFRFGYTKIDIGIFNCGVGGACGISETFAQDVGIPNVNDGTLEQSGSILTGGFGVGFVEFAGDGGPFIVNSKNPYFADTLTILKGNHSLKFGGEVRLRHLHTIDGGRTGGLKGNLAYADNLPATGTNLSCPVASQHPSFNATTGAGCFVDSNGIPFGGSGWAIASMLDNRVAALQTFRGSVPGGAFDLRSQEYGFFIQDDFKASDRLTLNLGLRYDIFPAATEKSGRLGNFDPATRTVIVASGSDDSLIETDKN
ncbi:MAG TPA: TonB-dependent receptor, partial [Pyrinomonadaceae bacterium]